MGQVWSTADFDGSNPLGHEGGRGSVLAVTAQNAGPNGFFGDDDDVPAPMNQVPVQVSVDVPGDYSCFDLLDRVRSFNSLHSDGAFFLMADGSVQFLSEQIEQDLYRHLSTIRGEEYVELP